MNKLVKYYNSFYQSISILSEQDKELKQFRILLSDCVGQVIKSSMRLLGIEVPNVMWVFSLLPCFHFEIPVNLVDFPGFLSISFQ